MQHSEVLPTTLLLLLLPGGNLVVEIIYKTLCKDILYCTVICPPQHLLLPLLPEQFTVKTMYKTFSTKYPAQGIVPYIRSYHCHQSVGRFGKSAGDKHFLHSTLHNELLLTIYCD